MDLSTFANLINAVAVTAGVIFAATQIRDYRAQRRRESMLNLVQSFQSPTFAHVLLRVVKLPDNATPETIRQIIGSDADEIIAHLTGVFESVGLLVFHGELTLDIVDDFFSGPILLSWRKLQIYIESMREQLGRGTWSEWFQWLAERLIERETHSPVVPAYIAHRPLKPTSR